jgi:hypothetical protein
MDPQALLAEQKRLARNAYQREWRAINRDKVNASRATYREKHPDVVLESNRRHEASRKEKRILAKASLPPKPQKVPDPDKAKASKKAWREANPEKVVAIRKRYNDAHRDELRESLKCANAKRRAEYEAIQEATKKAWESSETPNPSWLTKKPLLVDAP